VTLAGERGVAVAQRQGIAITRASLQEAPVLFLNEVRVATIVRAFGNPRTLPGSSDFPLGEALLI
jgi:hypothetical protein